MNQPKFHENKKRDLAAGSKVVPLQILAVPESWLLDCPSVECYDTKDEGRMPAS